MIMQVRLGSLVSTQEATAGVVSDIGHGEALVRLSEGADLSVMDRDHGRWYPLTELKVTGYDAQAWVWRGPRMVVAGPLPITRNEGE
jgi:hypothetical protein